MSLWPEIKKILVIGSGPIIIGQAAEFDYSGSQACRSLREEGMQVVLINSNPATIMTDHETADAVYVEPIDVPHVEAIIAIERPDAILPTLGGQTGLNLAVELYKAGILKKYRVRLLGTTYKSITQAEDRELFRSLMLRLNMSVPQSKVCYSKEEIVKFADKICYPVILRPAYTLGGSGGGIAYNREECEYFAERGLQESPTKQVLVEKCLTGWKELEFEVMRDIQDNCMIVCHMENIDPMGIHTGDSIVVAPCLTLNDHQIQLFRDAAIKIIRALKIVGGCNIQFAMHPKTNEYAVIEVNPRVSRSSALASKATGYPIARVAAKLALGRLLTEVINPVTGRTLAIHEPALDYIVVKVPKWPFDKFKDADRILGSQMKATGEVMAIGRTFKQAFLKSLWSLEAKLKSLRTNRFKDHTDDHLAHDIKYATDGRLFATLEALTRKWPLDKVHQLSGITHFFLEEMLELVEIENDLKQRSLSGFKCCDFTKEELQNLKQLGFSDNFIASILECPEEDIRKSRDKFNIHAGYKAIDTCAAEFAANSPYFYSSYCDEFDFSPKRDGSATDKAIIVLGSGPIRIGQGIEFDYCSVHAIKALRHMGYRAIMINNNPETVSTDSDVSDSLYFEPLNFESVLEVIDNEQAKGVMVQFGGQTALNLAKPLEESGVKLLGADLRAIDLAEDRKMCDVMLSKLNIPRPPGVATTDYDKIVQYAQEIGFPVLVRPSFVLGGRAMLIVHNARSLQSWIDNNKYTFNNHPVLVDKYIEGTEVEVDLVCDGDDVVIPGIMEHIERAGVHSGDSMAVYPPQRLRLRQIYTICKYSTAIAKEMNVRGLVNLQFVLQHDKVYVLEVNPRASRTVPFISKVTGVPLIHLAVLAAMGHKFRDNGIIPGFYSEPGLVAVKAPVFSFIKLKKLDVGLGPEMKSTGEVMGIGRSYPQALRKAMTASGIRLPQVSENVWYESTHFGNTSAPGLLVTVADKDKEDAVSLIWGFTLVGFEIFATKGTCEFLNSNGIKCKEVNKIGQGHPDIYERIGSGDFKLIINTISDAEEAEEDGSIIRRRAVEKAIPVLTSLDTADAVLRIFRSTFEGLQRRTEVTPLAAISNRYPHLVNPMD